MKKTIRITALLLAMLMNLTALVCSFSAETAALTADEKAVNQGYACKIVSADGTQTTYYKYFSPVDVVIDGGVKKSAFAFEGVSKANIKAMSAVQSVASGETIVLLKDIELIPDTTYSNPNSASEGKNVQGKNPYIRSQGAAFTIDGQGHSYTSAGGFIANSNDLTVKNLNFVLTGLAGNNAYENIGHARSGHTLSFENCNFSIGVQREGDGYFVFNSGSSANMVLTDCKIELQKGTTPVVPLFYSNQANSHLTLNNVTADYSKYYATADATEATSATVGTITSTNTGMEVILKGTTNLVSAVRAVEFQKGGSIVMHDDAVLASTTTTGNDTTQVIYAHGGAGTSFYLEMNDDSKIQTKVAGIGINKIGSNEPCETSTVVMNDRSQIDANRSFRIDTASAKLLINDSSKVYLAADESFDGVATANPIWVSDSNKNCQIYVNSDAVIAKKSVSVRVPYTYGTGISMIEGKEGLRFDSRIQADTDALEFGTLIATQKTVLGLTDFTHAALADAEAKFLDIKASLENCLTYKIKEDGNDFYLFSATLAGITDPNLQYAARAYAKYAKGSTEADSQSGIWIYSNYDPFTNNRSHAYVAYEAVNDLKSEQEKLSDTVDVNGDGFYHYNVAEPDQTPLYSRYTKEQYLRLKEMAEKYTEYLQNHENTHENLNSYKETTKEGDVNIHKVEIGTPGDGKTATTIVQITDLHLRANGEEAGPGSAATALSNANKSLAWANANADQIVITGDFFNAYSEADASLFESVVWNNTYKGKTMVALGNHDFMGTNNGAELAGKEWTKPYQCKVINNVMLIALDNASNGAICSFTDEQYDWLAADLAEARAKGYDVLLFYHIPLPTGFSADAELKRLDNNGDELNDTINLYAPTHKDYSQWRNDYATQNLYKLITSNADIIDAAFCGHKHVNNYSEIQGIDGNIIPQYTLISNAYGIGGSVIEITVYN